MSYKEKIQEILSKDLKPPSVKLYSIKLQQLYNDLNGKDNNNNHLKDTNKVMNYINKLNGVDNKLAFLNAVIKIGFNEKIFIDTRKDLNTEKINKYKSNVQTADFVDYKVLLDATPAPDFNKDSLEKVIHDIMLYFSVRYPMRLILHNIIVVRNKAHMEDKTKNYIYITNNSVSFVLNQFKTVNELGQQTIKLFDGDAIIVRNYLKFLRKHKVSSNKFILNHYLQPLEYNANSPDMYARNLSKKLLKRTGKKLTMNNIRQSYSSALIQSDAYRQMTNQEKDNAHLRLLHTGNMANLAYNRVEPCKV